MDEWLENTDDQEVAATDATEDTSPHETDAIADPQTNAKLTSESEPSSSQHEASDIADLTAEDASVIASNPIDIPSDGDPSRTPSRTSALLARRQAANPVSHELSTMNGNIDMPVRLDEEELNVQLEHQRTNTQTPDPEQIIAGEGPLTPRNNAGPFVFDGSAGRSEGRQSVVPGIPEITERNGTILF
jgi:hypothetical protein